MFIIYGAGIQGKKIYNFLKWRKLDSEIYCFCDKNYEKIKKLNDINVIAYKDAMKLGLPFLIAAERSDYKKEIEEILKNDSLKFYHIDEMYKVLNEEQVDYLREYCAYYHAVNNDLYFDDAEKEEALNVFWDEKSEFKQYFNMLDLTNVIELACGRGRHVPQYISKAGHITLVDILQENMDFCAKRFMGIDKISYYKNNGYNLEKLDENAFTSLFTYDAMVHFEMMDIYDYLKDIYRILQSGGKALFHHSNCTISYKQDFTTGVHARSFMSKDIFAYFAYRIGFKIIDQKIIHWYDAADLDCISIIEK